MQCTVFIKMDLSAGLSESYACVSVKSIITFNKKIVRSCAIASNSF